jgi:hypothetical protein
MKPCVITALRDINFRFVTTWTARISGKRQGDGVMPKKRFSSSVRKLSRPLKRTNAGAARLGSRQDERREGSTEAFCGSFNQFGGSIEIRYRPFQYV